MASLQVGGDPPSRRVRVGVSETGADEADDEDEMDADVEAEVEAVAHAMRVRRRRLQALRRASASDLHSSHHISPVVRATQYIRVWYPAMHNIHSTHAALQLDSLFDSCFQAASLL